MIADLKPYPEYKELGLPWLGRVPRHWEILQARHVGRFLKGVGGTKDDAVAEGVSCVRYGALYTRYTSFIRNSTAFIKVDRAAAYTPTCYGDVLFAATGETIEEIGKSAVNLMTTPAVCGGDIILLRPSIPVHAPFIGYAFDCQSTIAQKASMGRGTTVKHIYPGELRKLLVPFPSPQEQAAIARFLDWANGRLARSIRAKRKVIALLHEQKQAIIHSAVTRGLDASVPLKPSGIEWLGDIPQHWEIRRLKSLSRCITSGSRGWARYYADAGFVFLRVGNISTTSIDLRLAHLTYVAPPMGAEGERTRAAPDDLLLSITAQIGAVGIVPADLGEAFVNQHTALIRLRPQQSIPRWVAYGLLSQFGKDQCRLMTNGGTKVGLTLDDVRCLSVLLPPIQEQLRLVSGIENQTRELDIARSQLEREIELLREYRTRLIADVVTGKLDVREAATRLPSEPPPDTADDDADPKDEIEFADVEDAAA